MLNPFKTNSLLSALDYPTLDEIEEVYDINRDLPVIRMIQVDEWGYDEA